MNGGVLRGSGCRSSNHRRIPCRLLARPAISSAPAGRRPGFSQRSPEWRSWEKTGRRDAAAGGDGARADRGTGRQRVGAPRSALCRWRARAEPRSRRPRRVRQPNRPRGLAEAVKRPRLDHPIGASRQAMQTRRRQKRRRFPRSRPQNKRPIPSKPFKSTAAPGSWLGSNRPAPIRTCPSASCHPGRPNSTAPSNAATAHGAARPAPAPIRRCASAGPANRPRPSSASATTTRPHGALAGKPPAADLSLRRANETPQSHMSRARTKVCASAGNRLDCPGAGPRSGRVQCLGFAVRIPISRASRRGSTGIVARKGHQNGLPQATVAPHEPPPTHL